MSERTLSPEKTAVTFTVGMSPDKFRAVQDQFVHDFAAILGCETKEIEIHGVHPALPDISSDCIDAAQLQALGKMGLTEY